LLNKRLFKQSGFINEYSCIQILCLVSTLVWMWINAWNYV